MEFYEYDSLFFIAYAQSLCSIKSPQQQEFDTMYNLMSDESLLLKTVADHSESFKTAFRCSEKSTKTCKNIYWPGEEVYYYFTTSNTCRLGQNINTSDDEYWKTFFFVVRSLLYCCHFLKFIFIVYDIIYTKRPWHNFQMASLLLNTIFTLNTHTHT